MKKAGKQKKDITTASQSNKKQHIDDHNFHQYKRRIVIEDIKTVKQKYKLYFFEWLPVIGSIIYALRMQICLAGINRGALRKNIMYYYIILTFCTLFLFHYAVILSALPLNYCISLAIKKTELQLEEGKF